MLMTTFGLQGGGTCVRNLFDNRQREEGRLGGVRVHDHKTRKDD